MRRPISILCSAACLLALSACSIHTVDIQQGNIITPEMVQQLKPGMTKQQVRFIMGTPTIVDTFHPDRWDYIYTLKEKTGKQEQKHVGLFFDGDELTRIEADSALQTVPPAGSPGG